MEVHVHLLPQVACQTPVRDGPKFVPPGVLEKDKGPEIYVPRLASVSLLNVTLGREFWQSTFY